MRPRRVCDHDVALRVGVRARDSVAIVFQVTESVTISLHAERPSASLRSATESVELGRPIRRRRGGRRGADARRRGRDDVVIAIDHVTKRFGAFVAVDDADFDIRRGEFFSMLGPSGCGKTTTLRMIAGFEQPTEGEIRLEGDDVSQVPPYKRNVNTVFQQYALFPHMTVWDNVAFGLKAKKVAEGRDREAGRRAARDRAARRLRRPQARAALRRPAAARRAGPGARELPERAAARRAARRARPQAAPGDAARAQAHPARGRHHVHLRDPRSGRGAHDERPDRGDERGPGRADRHARGDLPPARHRVRRRLHRHGQPAARRRSSAASGELAVARRRSATAPSVDAPAVDGPRRRAIRPRS